MQCVCTYFLFVKIDFAWAAISLSVNNHEAMRARPRSSAYDRERYFDFSNGGTNNLSKLIETNEVAI